jgi:MFS family permease
LAPALAGYLFEKLGWCAVFAVNVPIAGLGTACALAVPADGRISTGPFRPGNC